MAGIGIDNTYDADIKLDVVQALLDNDMPDLMCDVSVAFGLLHHIPDYKLRLRLIKYMIEHSSIDKFSADNSNKYLIING